MTPDRAAALVASPQAKGPHSQPGGRGADGTQGRSPEGRGDPLRTRRRVLLVVLLGVFMATLDGSVVNLALPAMAETFRKEPGAVAGVVSVYLVAVAATLLLFGALGDRLGKRRLYLFGFAVFTAGSALCATAWSLEILLGFRVVQAVGGAMVLAVGPALLTLSYPRTERGAALGWIGTAVAGGQTAGPVLGGLLIGALGWPLIFLINVPIGAAALYLARGVPRGAAPESSSHHAGAHVPHQDGKGHGLGNRAFVAANASTLLSFASIGAVAFAIPFYLAQVLGMAAFTMGLVMLATPLAIAAVGPLSGRLSDRIGPQIPCAVGLALAAAAVGALSTVDQSSSELDVVVRLALFGAGMALFQAPNNSAALGAVSPRLLGAASGMLATMRVVGLAVGVSVCGLLLGVFYASNSGGAPLPPGDVPPNLAAYVAAQHLTFLAFAGVCAAGIATSLVRSHPSLGPPEQGSRPA